MKWDYYIHKFIYSYCVTRGLSRESLKTYLIDLETFSSFMLKEKNVSCPTEVKSFEVYDYLEFLRQSRGCGNSTVYKHSTIIKRFYQGLESLGYVDYYQNPLKSFRLVKRGVERVRDVLTTKEFKKLIRTIKEDSVVNVRDKTMITLLFGTGIRASELCGIKLKDIDFDGYKLKVFGKGQKEREVILEKVVVKSLKKYLRFRQKTSKNQYLFLTRQGKGVSRKGLYDRVKKWVRLSGIKKVISPHSLRHSFATAMVKAGACILSIQRLLGHSNPSSTERYTRDDPEGQRMAMEKHPINDFTDIINRELGDVRLPIQLSRSCFK